MVEVRVVGFVLRNKVPESGKFYAKLRPTASGESTESDRLLKVDRETFDLLRDHARDARDPRVFVVTEPGIMDAPATADLALMELEVPVLDAAARTTISPT